MFTVPTSAQYCTKASNLCSKEKKFKKEKNRKVNQWYPDWKGRGKKKEVFTCR